MTDRIALILAIILAGFIVADYLWLDFGASLFLGRRFLELVEYLAFWR